MAMTATTHYLSLKLLVPTHTHTHTSPPPSGAARHGNPVPADGESVWCGAGAVIRLAKNILVKNISTQSKNMLVLFRRLHTKLLE